MSQSAANRDRLVTTTDTSASTVSRDQTAHADTGVQFTRSAVNGFDTYACAPPGAVMNTLYLGGVLTTNQQ